MKKLIFYLLIFFYYFGLNAQVVELIGTDDPNFVNQNGKIGIGTSSPTKNLTLSSNGNVYSRIQKPAYSDFFDFGIATHTAIINYSAGVVNRSKISFRTNNSNRLSIDYNGNIGIGTTSPTHKLEVYGGGNFLLRGGNNDAGDIIFQTNTQSQLGRIWTNNSGKSGLYLTSGDNSPDLIINENGYIGIGITSPKASLHVNGDIYTKGHLYLYAYEGDGNSGTAYIQARDKSQNSSIDLQFRTQENGAIKNAMRILKNGNVGIGTTNPLSKLSVNGHIRATEVKVLANINIPDYVFESDYDLRPLQEVEEFIKVNKHLPNIPSATEFKEEGMDLGEMNARLLEKVEELTLYLIEQAKKDKSHEQLIITQKKQIDQQFIMIEQLKQQLSKLETKLNQHEK